MNIAEWQIRIEDRSGTSKSFIASTSGTSPLLSAKWSLNRIGGCGPLELQVPRGKITGTINTGYIIEVWIKPIGGALTRYYKGYITEVPSPGGTEDVSRYKADGIWRQVETTILTKYYEGKNTEDMVKDIIGVINGDIDLDSATTEVVIGTDYAIGDFEGELISAAQAIKLIADVQKDVQYGVDQDGKLYFKDNDTTIVERFWVGKHIDSFVPTKRTTSQYNHFLLQAKKMVGGAMLTVSKEDATSITNYGRKTKVVTVPELRTHADLWRYGDHLLADQKDEHDSVSVAITTFTDFRFPRGKAAVQSEATLVQLPIQAVKYELTGDGLAGTMDLGDEDRPTLSDDLKRISREIEIGKSRTISLTKIEHTRGEEFRQVAVVDAHKNDKLNVFLDAFDTTKAIDRELSSNVWFRDVLNYFGVHFDFTKSTILSVGVGTGEEVGTVRVHADCDFYGRINFISHEELETFWDQGAADYVIRDGFAQLKGITNSQDLYYWHAGTIFSLPVNYGVGGKISMVNSVASDGYVLFAWADASNYSLFRFKNNASRTETAIIKVVGGTPTTISTNALSGEDDFTFLITVRNTPTNSTVYVEDVGDAADNHTLSGAVASATGARIGYKQLRTGGTDIGYGDYFEIQEIGDIDIYVSRDDGTTWTQATIVHGTNHVDVDVSGQPSGTTLRLKAEITHPARLYGWGFSWKN